MISAPNRIHPAIRFSLVSIHGNRPGKYRPAINWSWFGYDRFNSPLLPDRKGRRRILKGAA